MHTGGTTCNRCPRVRLGRCDGRGRELWPPFAVKADARRSAWWEGRGRVEDRPVVVSVYGTARKLS